MNKMRFTFLLLLVSVGLKAQPLPQVSSGKIERISDFQSKLVEPRNIDVWLPENYDGKKNFAVLYMHDGQMLFDSTIAWNKQSWNVDEIASRLMKEKKVEDFIVVGIWNGGMSRHKNYFPQKPFESLNAVEKDTVVNQLQRSGRTKDVFQPNSDNYLKFLVTELKPMIDKKYSVHADRTHTFIAGSSMGGLISLYAICEYPKVFGGAACLSTHWTGTFTNLNNPVPDAFVAYLQKNLPNPKNHKIYFDYGDQTLDALYPPYQKRVDEVMKLKGFKNNRWITKYFPGKDHSERSWAARFEIPMQFLLKK